MAKKSEKDMNELILLKKAAAEIGLDPSHLVRRIGEGMLKADKFGGHEWWIRRADLMEFDASRRPPGPRVADRRPGETEAQAKRREYNRLHKQRSRERLKNADEN